MLVHWHKQGNNISVIDLLHAVDIPPLIDDLSLISNILLDKENSLQRTVNHRVLQVKQFALMIRKVSEIISNSKTDIDEFKQYLDIEIWKLTNDKLTEVFIKVCQLFLI